MKQVVVIGGGAAGMFAAVQAAACGAAVTLLEQNEKLGKKLFITGKGRCNVTNACDRDTFFSSVLTNPKFLYGAYARCSSADMMAFFEDAGVPLKIERGNRVFPVSDHSSDIIRGLEQALSQAGVHIRLNTKVKEIRQEQNVVSGVVLTDGSTIPCDACILAAGGLSYPSTGSTGDGYRMAEKLGHTLTELRPGLVPIETKETFVMQLMGLSLRNVRAKVLSGEKVLFDEFGEMLFTHFGVSGPLILSASSVIGAALGKKELTLSIDLKPALSDEQLENRLIRELSEHGKKSFRNAVSGLFPAKLLPVIVARSGIPETKRANEITRKEREAFASLIRNFTVTLCGLRPFREAIITCGGIPIREINPKTMESKKCKGLFFAGEMIDLDGVTGGFNLQIAWTTAYAAGHAAAEKIKEQN